MASFDRTRNLSVNYICDLPGSPWRSGVARSILRGWRLSGKPGHRETDLFEGLQ